MGKSSGVAIFLAGARVFCLGMLALLLTLPCNCGITASAIAKNYESDNHTLGVELDTYMNPGFNDTNNNHSGINLASMNSTYSFTPAYSLASSSVILYLQIWIDCFSVDSRMDIYYANYNQGKPAKPQGSQRGLHLSLLKENMFTGFSSTNKLESFDDPYVCVWSFSNDGIPALLIVIAQDATPGAPPPPAPDGPVAAPSLPPPVPPQSPAPGISSPPPSPASNPPPLRTPNPSPFNPPIPPPPSSVLPQGPNSEPPTVAKKGGKKKDRLGIPVGVSAAVLLFVGLVGLCIFVLSCRRRFLRHPLHIFLSHAGGADGSEKIFPISLHERMKTYRWSFSTQSNITFFFDKAHIDFGELYAERIIAELARFDVGLVVVTNAFFEAKWPMTELIAFVEAHIKNDPTKRLRVLPLFYKLKPEDLKDHSTWEPRWKEMSKGDYPLEVDKCRDAVNWLCKPRGILYDYERRDNDKEYIEKICKELDKILCKERNFPEYLWRAITSFRVPSDCRPRMTRNLQVRWSPESF